MIGAQDFCGHYDWTFEYIRRTWGEEWLERYWVEAIAHDSQRHAMELIRTNGVKGMLEYWKHSLTMEQAGYALAATSEVFRIDMHDCPSKGYLLDRGQEEYHDYCAHCMGWIAAAAEAGGFTVDHEHNHHGQCWWELRRKGCCPSREELEKQIAPHDVTKSPAWNRGEHHHYRDTKLVEKSPKKDDPSN